MATFEAAIAANRFGLGARPGELDEIGGDHADWLLAQLDARDGMPTQSVSSADVLREVGRLQSIQQQLRRDDRSSDAANEATQNYRTYIRDEYQRQVARRYTLATSTDLPFRERLVHFWTNHFAISSDKQAVTPIVGTFEDEAIRPNVTGRFADMLRAVEQHPGSPGEHDEDLGELEQKYTAPSKFICRRYPSRAPPTIPVECRGITT